MVAYIARDGRMIIELKDSSKKLVINFVYFICLRVIQVFLICCFLIQKVCFFFGRPKILVTNLS